jgi:succinyl-diaminopimelate desuccinylase
MLRDLIFELLAIPSISPNDAGCQKILQKHLEALGFHVENMPFGDIDNLWAVYGESGPIMAFAGHTDVVPPGPVDEWRFDPFTPTIDDGKLYARGSADMKVALCCMVAACQNYLKQQTKLNGRIAFLITGCEEITTDDGTKNVIHELVRERDEDIQWCIVGEASSNKQLGDQIKVGRRGSLSGDLIVHGKQGHIAYPDTASNAIHLAMAALDELATTQWDKGNKEFAPTSFQLSNINAGTGANNVIPGQLNASFNFRYSPESTAQALQKKVEAILDKHQLPYSLTWSLSGEPFLSKIGKLVTATKQAIHNVAGLATKTDTGGGTSDARFIAPYGIETLELGFCNDTIHKINEAIAVDDIEKLVAIYQEILTQLFA